MPPCFSGSSGVDYGSPGTTGRASFARVPLVAESSQVDLVTVLLQRLVHRLSPLLFVSLLLVGHQISSLTRTNDSGAHSFLWGISARHAFIPLIERNSRARLPAGPPSMPHLKQPIQSQYYDRPVSAWGAAKPTLNGSQTAVVRWTWRGLAG
jgi:hypothetical protein